MRHKTLRKKNEREKNASFLINVVVSCIIEIQKIGVFVTNSCVKVINFSSVVKVSEFSVVDG